MTSISCIAIVGGSGFVGTEIVSRLAAAGHSLRVPSREWSRTQHLAPLPTVERLRLNVHDPAALGQLVAGCDVVINLVGILNERGRDGQGFLHAHTELTRKLIDACAANQVRKFVQMSALGADENGPSHYLRSKGLAETLVRAAPEHLDWTLLRPSVIFGRGDSLLNRFATLLRLSGGWMPLARAHARFAPVWVTDVARAFELSLSGELTRRQSFDLCGPRVMTLRELVEFTGHQIGVRSKVIPLPDSVGRAQAAIMDFIPGKPFSTDNFNSLSLDNVCHDPGMQRLGVQPTSLDTIAPTYLGGARGA
jgi:NADH dehydrogenase